MSDSGLAAQVIERLLAEAQLAIDAGDLPIGCVITAGDSIVSGNRNTIYTKGDRRFHAERNLITQLSSSVLPASKRVLWVTLEPCLRCAQAIQRFGVDEVVYVLDDPFGGGKKLLAEAGITLTKRTDWEFAVLQRVMESYSRHPERCFSRFYPLVVAAWQHHQPLDRTERTKAVFVHHLSPYLAKVPEARQDDLRRSFHTHVDYLTQLTLRDCAGVPSVDFVRTLHQALFPPNFRHRVANDDGISDTGSGEWRKHDLVCEYRKKVLPPDSIETDLTALLSGLSAKTSLMREDTLRFIIDFWTIHPFTDGNGRVAAILADVICLNHGLAPLALDAKNKLLYTALLENLARQATISEQLELVDGWNSGRLGLRPRNIYDDHPSAFQTYTRRSGDKRYVVAQVLAKLAERQLSSPFVVTDIGAGTGVIADGILHGLAQREGLAFEYHYLEPSQVSIDAFRQYSRYANMPQVMFHAMPSEDFLPPPSDLIVVGQTLQHLPSPGETLCDVVDALKPGGLALVVVTHPDGDEARMEQLLTGGKSTYSHLKAWLDRERIHYEENKVVTAVQISPDDRDTPKGDDLLTFYFNTPVTALPEAKKQAFWTNLSDFCRNGAISKTEAFFWIARECVTDSFERSLPAEARPYWNQRYLAFPRWDEGIQTDWQGLYSVKPEVLALQLAASMPGEVVLDAFCGIGGCAIAFARSGKKVLTVEIDERRLEMARNNAQVYGVEDRITFIHGDVTELVETLEYDAAFFDPPWGGPEQLQKTVFGWDDMSPNPLPLIHVALARCATAVLAAPVNFRVDDLRLESYTLDLQRLEMDGRQCFINAFFRKTGTA